MEGGRTGEGARSPVFPPPWLLLPPLLPCNCVRAVSCGVDLWDREEVGHVAGESK